jgi:phosphoribosylglycinamide formyltransferase-1
MFKIVVIASTAGSVLSKLLELSYFREKIHCVVSDRECGAIEIAKRYSVPTLIEKTNNGSVFSDFLHQHFKNEGVDLYVSFYTRLFSGDFIQDNKYKLINLHPSILPACPGMDGFGDTINSGARFIGSTIHLVNSGIDTGLPIIQSAVPYNPILELTENRHKIFIQQCKMLLQVINWFEEERVIFETSQVIIKNAQYYLGEYSPNLDFDLALNFLV